LIRQKYSAEDYLTADIAPLRWGFLVSKNKGDVMSDQSMQKLEERLLKLEQVISWTGLSKSAVYGKPDFPRPIKISARSSAWLSSEVQAWIQRTIAASRQTGGDERAA
jgi:prophage regulatory protein